MVLDLKHVKDWLQQVVVGPMDHRNLQDLEYFQSRPSSAENVAIYIWDQLLPLLQERQRVDGDKDRYWMHKIQVQETESIIVSYKGPQ